MTRRWRRAALWLLLCAWAGTALWHTNKALPGGTQLASASCAVPAESVGFIADVSAADAYGRPAVSQAVFDSVLAVVHGARRFIVLDYHLFGTDGAGSAPRRALARELTDALLAQKRAHPELAVLFIMDPVNEGYGAARPQEPALLRAADVSVVSTDLDVLRDSNYLYTSLWRLALRWWQPPGPLAREARGLNFKADHRKVILADDGHGGLTGIVGSANPLDAQSGWSNLAVRVSGGPLGALLESELAVARFSGWRGAQAAFLPAEQAAAQCHDAAAPGSALTNSLVRVQLLTEGAIRAALLAELGGTVRGDSIDLALYTLTDRDVVQALLDAARRGASVRLILDPSEDRTRLAPSGLPNQAVASELVARSGGAIQVRWYRTHGERFHGSLALLSSPTRVWLTLGSANFTRRSLDDYDLEANAALELTADAPLAEQARGYFEQLWGNRAGGGIEYTADFAVFADPSQADYWLGRLLEATGLSDF
ncbi:MAG TPA: phospholipase D-like domain-containing protein [Steroidobacteraceae bacterium]|nr:phospholipase D-like domain-containing protein [Steroidobacteraceae bacterium]